MTELPSINQPETPGQDQVLPDVSLPIAEFDSPNPAEKAVTQEHQRKAAGAARKILAGTAAVFSAVTLAAGKAEARTSQGVQANTPAAINPTGAEAANSAESKKPILDAGKYTHEYFEKLYNHEIPFGYFNGVAILDSKVAIYTAIDPYLRIGRWTYGWPMPKDKEGKITAKNWNEAVGAREHNRNDGKFGSMYRMGLYVDEFNTVWLSTSMATRNYLDPGRRPWEGLHQAYYRHIFVPLSKDNIKHIKLYRLSGQPILAGAVDTVSDTDGSRTGNYIVTTPGYERIPAGDLAAWDTFVLMKERGSTYKNNEDWDWGYPAYEPMSRLKSYLQRTVYPVSQKNYVFPSGKKIKQMIDQARPRE